MKICVNRQFGGFGLSQEAEDLYMKKLGRKLFRYMREGNYASNDYVRVDNPSDNDFSIITFTQNHGAQMIYDHEKEQGYWYYGDIERDDPMLVETVEELGAKADGKYADLSVVEIPDGEPWEIYEYDGYETAERPRQEY